MDPVKSLHLVLWLSVTFTVASTAYALLSTDKK